jgi:predicted ATPase
VVGREADLERLHGWLAQAHGGHRQIVLIAGEPGIGKTALVDTFVSQIGNDQRCWPVRGQCLEHHGPGEPYRPILEALGQLGQRPDGAQVTAILRQYAPMWLMHLPALVPADAWGTLRDMTMGITKARMLRELVDAVAVMTAEHTLVLVLEDLHWSDGATLDLIGLLARQRLPARLFILGTYRPADMHLHNPALYTLTQELDLHRQCVGLDLQRLSVSAVETYLAQRFPEQMLPPMFAQWLHHHTEGHPLFMTGVVAYVEAQGLIGSEVGAERLGAMIPSSVAQLTELYLSRLWSEASWGRR